jgi:AsmA protein
VTQSLKILALVAGTVVVLLGLALVALGWFFDPNQYRDDIIRAVKAATGRDLKIGKRIGWSLFPRVGIEAGALELSNAPGFGKEPFATIDAAGVRVEFWPLLRGKLAVDTVYVHGATLHLAKDARGRSNWDDLTRRAQTTAPKPAPEKTEPRAHEVFTLGKFDIRDTTVAWRDAASGSAVTVRQLALTTGRFAVGSPTDLKLSFTLERSQAAPIRLALTSQLTAEPDALRVSALDMKLDDSRLTGTLGIRNFGQPALRFDLAVDQLDLDRYLGAGPAPKPAAAGPSATKPPATPGASEPSHAAWRMLDIDGQLKLKTLKAFGLRATEAQAGLHAKAGLIRLPVSARLYGGRLSGETTLDARGRQVQLAISETVNDIALAPLLKDAYQFGNFHGQANASARLTAQGLTAELIKSSLTGTAEFAVKDGKIEGVDLKKMTAAIDAAIKNRETQRLRELKPARGDVTPFTQLRASTRITRGIARNDDLVLDGPGLARVTGKGEADLARATLDYRLSVGALPILISGPFADLKYAPDVTALTGTVLEQKLDERLERQKQKLLERYRRKQEP